MPVSSLAASVLSVISPTPGPKPLPKPFLHRERASASYFNFQYPRLSLRLSSSCLSLLSRLPATSSHYLSFNNVLYTAVPTPDVTNPVSLLSFYCTQDLPVILASHDRSNGSSASFSSITFPNFPGISFPKRSGFSTVQSYAPNTALY